jgi:hypothetical protein
MKFAHFEGMAWPLPDLDCGQLTWRLRYQTLQLSRQDRVNAAAIIDAYTELASCKNSKRKLVGKAIKRELEKSNQKESEAV